MLVWFKEQWLENGRNGRGLYWKPRSTKDCDTSGGGGEIINIQNNPKKL
jgi:hypothetical protein